MVTKTGGKKAAKKPAKKVAAKGRKRAPKEGGALNGQVIRGVAGEGLAAGRVYDCPTDCNRLTVIVRTPRPAIARERSTRASAMIRRTWSPSILVSTKRMSISCQ